MGCPAILKTAGFGYDGKGQVRIHAPAEADAAWQALGGQECVLEAFVAFEREVSVVAARGLDGAFAHYGLIQNAHVNDILDISLAPPRIGGRRRSVRRDRIARAVLEALDVVGVLCVEFFQTGDGRLLVNELAPRPHNSGHLTIDACVTSQFEQQLRAVCGLPLGSTRHCGPPRWRTCWAICGRTANPTGPRRSPSRTSNCTSTAKRRRDPDGRWAT